MNRELHGHGTRLLATRQVARRTEDRAPVYARSLPRSLGNLALGQLLASDVVTALVTRAGQGVALSAPSRRALEAAFSRELSHIRIHDNSWSRAAAALLGARAFTAGHHIWLGRNARGDAALVGHEVAHVIQQDRASPPHRGLISSAAGVEHAAVLAGDAVAAGQVAGPVGRAPVGVHLAKMEERPIEQLLADPEVAKRLEEVVKAGGDVRGEIVEELGQARIREAIERPAGRAAVLGEKYRDVEVSFFEGRRVHAVGGGKLSDGMVLAGSGEDREALLIAEFKQSKENELAERIERRPTTVNVEEAKREAKTSGAPVPRKEAGQFVSVRERILDDGHIEVLENGKWVKVRVRLTKDTIFHVGSPNAKALDRALAFYRKGGRGELYGVRVSGEHIDVTKSELAEAEKRLAAKLNVEPPSVRNAALNRQAKASKKTTKHEPAGTKGNTTATKEPKVSVSNGPVEAAKPPSEQSVETFSEFPKLVVKPPPEAVKSKQPSVSPKEGTGVPPQQKKPPSSSSLRQRSATRSGPSSFSRKPRPRSGGGGRAGAEVIADHLENLLKRLNEAGIDKRIRDEAAARMSAIEAYQRDHLDDGVLLIARISEPDPTDARSLSQPNLRSFVTMIEVRGGRTEDEALDRYESTANLEQGYAPGHRGSERRLIWIRPWRLVRPDDWIGGTWACRDASHRLRFDIGPEGGISIEAWRLADGAPLLIEGVSWHIALEAAPSSTPLAPPAPKISVQVTMTDRATASRLRSTFHVIDANHIDEHVEGSASQATRAGVTRRWEKFAAPGQ